MRLIATILLLLLSAQPGLPGVLTRPRQQDPPPTASLQSVNITIPLPGSSVQGNIAIIGTSAVEDMVAFELIFAYTNNPTDTWFLIQQGQAAIRNDVLAEWDTTTISDGEYDLRLVVTLQNGEQLTSTVRGLRVRNYTPIETNTPTPVTPTVTPNPSKTPAPTVTPTPAATNTTAPRTPTALPTNPAQLSSQQVLTSAGWGALLSAALMIIFGLYLGLRYLIKRGWRT